jgi:hypothetical protein
MSHQWRIRISGKLRKEPDIALLVQAVLALSEQMQREQRDQAPEVVPTEPPPPDDTGAA